MLDRRRFSKLRSEPQHRGQLDRVAPARFVRRSRFTLWSAVFLFSARATSTLGTICGLTGEVAGGAAPAGPRRWVNLR
jgi:hypothetical protein